MCIRDSVNIGSDEMVTINELAEKVIKISKKENLYINNIDGPQGIRGRNSNNELIFDKLNWKPSDPLDEGLKKTYHWIEDQLRQKK